MFAEIRALADDQTNRTISLSDSTTDNVIQAKYSSLGSNQLRFQIRSGGVGGSNLDESLNVIDITTQSKIAFYYKENDCKIYINGLLVIVDESTDVPVTLSELAFDNGAGSEDFYGRVKKLSVYDQALSTTELESLTGFSSFAEMSSYLSYS